MRTGEGVGQEYRLPNLLVAGCQKCASSWLHFTLRRFDTVFGVPEKELDYFLKVPRDQSAYRRHFPVTPGVRYYLESSPNYFRRTVAGVDVAREIRAELGTPKIVVSFRNPVERYESSYIHHMLRGRFPYSPTIDAVVNAYSMLEIGRYAEIARHWNALLPGIHFVFYDDIVADPAAVIDGIASYLDLRGEMTPDRLDVRVLETRQRIAKRAQPWPTTPTLTARARAELQALYREPIAELEEMFHRDLSSWRA